MTATQEITDVEEDLSLIDPNDPDKAGHYFKIEHLDQMNFGERATVTALCGYETKSIHRPIDGRPACPKCKWLYENALVD